MKPIQKKISTVLSTLFCLPIKTNAITENVSVPKIESKIIKQKSSMSDQFLKMLNQQVYKYKDPKKVATMLTMSLATSVASREFFTIFNMIRNSKLPNSFPNCKDLGENWEERLNKFDELTKFISWEDISQKGSFGRANSYIQYGELRFWGLARCNFEKICFNHMVNEHKGTPYMQILAWDYILSELLGFSTKICKFPEKNEYVIIFGRNFNNETRLYLFNPFAYRRRNLNSYYSNIAQENMSLISISNDKKKINITKDFPISNYFTYNRNNCKIEVN